MEYWKIKEIAELWGLSERSVQALCADGKIEGAVRFGRSWMIPKTAKRPIDKRTREGRAHVDVDMPLPRKTPFLYMSDLYHTPGTADAVGESLAYHHEAQVLFEAEIAYARGEIEKVYESASYLLGKHSGFYAIQSAGMLLALCAIWRGDLSMWRRAKIHMAEAKIRDDEERDIISLAITAVDSMLYDTTSFPEWFKIGNFEPIHPEALTAAKVYYAKYLYATGYSLATKQIQIEGMQGLSLMSVLPLSIEPMISQARADRSIVAEIYLRMTCAAVYHNVGRDAEASRHIDRAVALALPDRLYGLLAEYGRPLDTLLERRLMSIDEQAYAEVKSLYKIYHAGWSRLSGSVRGKTISTTLSLKEREVAKLAAFGMSNPEIAKKLNMSLSVVKQAIRITSEKTGVRREEFAAIL